MLLSVTSGTLFPAADPIPLPAPVWLFKILHDLTLILHFAALFMMLGGLGLSLLLNTRGHRSSHAATISASGKLASWLPVLMTYVINLGIPPLLFAQVLYGRALYTSSVLLGAYWIAVIPLLIVGYHLLYVMKARASDGRSFVWPALGSLLALSVIGRIYSANMTLMLDPSIWRETYAHNASGTDWQSGPVGLIRFAYILASAVVGGGLLAGWVSRSRSLRDETALVLRRAAKYATTVGALAVATLGILAWAGQPRAVQEICSSSSLVWTLAVLVWGAGTAGLVALSALPVSNNDWKPRVYLSVAAFLQTTGFVVERDLVRDASLSLAGFDVWDRTVLVNWSVLVLFFGLFLGGLLIVSWLAWVGYRTTTTKEQWS